MHKNLNVAVVIAAYNRPESLQRLLASVSAAHYPEDMEVALVISLDNCGDDACLKVAEEHNWSAGRKKIIHHSENLGLKQHILQCGDLSADYDFIILLEDDLYVSRYYIDYALKVHAAYQHDDKIAGYSLYSYYYNETARKQFTPAHNGSDVYFLQLPSSWGQIWTSTQWQNFRHWLSNEYSEGMLNDYLIPENVIDWPDSSWKKLFIFYMVINDLYFVYPRISLSTNFMDAGTNQTATGSFLQVPLQLSVIDYRFVMRDETDFLYDSFCELASAAIKKRNDDLSGFDFAVDLYGTKPIKKIRSKYLLSSRFSYIPLFQYSLSLKPHELNVLYNIKGDDLVFARKATVSGNGYGLTDVVSNSYYYNIPAWLITAFPGRPGWLAFKRQIKRLLEISGVIEVWRVIVLLHMK